METPPTALPPSYSSATLGDVSEPGRLAYSGFHGRCQYLDHPNLVGQVDVQMAECDETNNITVFALTLGCT